MIEGNVDSGIEFDIASLLSVSDVVEVEVEPTTTAAQTSPEYHELKSRVVVGSPRTDFRESNMGSRTQLRRNLERQQVLDQEQREKQQAQARQNQIQSQNIAMPSSFHSTEVPPKVLQVKTRLQHPTQYHIKQKQQQAVKMFLNDSGDHQIPAHSMPNLAIPTSLDQQWISGSAPTEMEGTSAGLEDMNLLDEIILDHAVDFNHDTDLHSIEPSLTQMSSTLPQQTLYTGYTTLDVDSSKATSSSSCPPVFEHVSPPTHMSEEEQRMWAKDRQKKDNHNMIERRRRFNINDRIKELGTLLPKSYDQDMRQNKGSILKASVDYIKRLKKDSDQLRSEKEEKTQLEKNLQKLQLKYTQMMAVVKQNGAHFGLMEEMGSDMLVAPSSIINMQQPTMQVHMKAEEQLSPAAISTNFNSLLSQAFPVTTQCDFSMEDTSPVSGDPMLTSAPVSPDNEDSTF